MNKTRIDIVLPVSGGRLSIRKARWQDYLPLGEAPAALAEVPELKGEKKITPAQLEYTVRATNLMLVNCTTRVRFDDGRLLRIVDKSFAECDPATELTIEEMDDADATAIIKAINEFTGMSKEAAQAAKPFPAEQTTAGDASLHGEELRKTSDRTVEAVAR
jgi:hypothetical protein